MSFILSAFIEIHTYSLLIPLQGLELLKIRIIRRSRNGITSRILAIPVTNSSRRSNPSPKPECGAVPKRRVSKYHQISFSGTPIAAERALSFRNLLHAANADDFPDFREKHVHSTYGFAIFV